MLITVLALTIQRFFALWHSPRAASVPLLCVVDTRLGCGLRDTVFTSAGQEKHIHLGNISIHEPYHSFAFSHLSFKWCFICSSVKLYVECKTDLREDKHYLADHPGLVPVTTAQGEELRKQIGAAYYIECSSKTQQVDSHQIDLIMWLNNYLVCETYDWVIKEKYQSK